jgi:hypothetical protein
MARWWVPGLTIGYEHSFVHTAADFLKGVETDTPAEPTFATALETQRVCDAILRSSGPAPGPRPASPPDLLLDASGIRLAQHLLDRSLQRRQVAHHHLPDNLVVHDRIGVPQNVADACDVLPGISGWLALRCLGR